MTYQNDNQGAAEKSDGVSINAETFEPSRLTTDQQSSHPNDSSTTNVGRRWWIRGAAALVAAAGLAAAGAVGVDILRGGTKAVHDHFENSLVAVAQQDSGSDDQTWAMTQVVPEANESKLPSPDQMLLDHDPAAHGAVKVGLDYIKLVVSGNRDQSVVITDIKPNIIGKRPSVAGTLLWFGPQGAIRRDHPRFRPRPTNIECNL